MSERQEPELDRVREAMREHDERAADDQEREPDDSEPEEGDRPPS